MDNPVNRENTSRAVNGREGEVKPGGLGCRGRRSQIKKDLGRRPDVGPGGVEHRWLAIVPDTSIVAGSHHEADTVRVLAPVAHEGAPGRGSIVGRPASVSWQNSAIGRHAMFPIVKLVGIPIRNANFPHRGSLTQRHQGYRSEVQCLPAGHRDVRLFESTRRAWAESPKVIGTGQYVGNSETAASPRLDPELACQVLLLKIDAAVHRCQPDPHAHAGGSRIVGIADGEGAADCPSAAGLGIG